MPKPQLSGAQFSKLTRTGTSDGTVSGADIAVQNTVTITTKNGKKEWQGPVVEPTADPLIWKASVSNTEWNDDDPIEAPETVTVTVSNEIGTSNPVDTTTNIP